MIKAILTDIEGTTTSVSFVYETLFPYFVEHVDDLLHMLDNEEVVACFREIKQQISPHDPNSVSDTQVIEQLKDWVSEDKKETHLKTLQGLLWKQAYLSGDIKGHVYPDVETALKNWRKLGISLNVYSSGSVAAQKLIFGYSEAGDLSIYFDQYFDTRIGHKRESASYQNILEQLALPPEEILFLSDIEAELDAAKEAGYTTLQLVRPGTNASSKHQTVNSFSEIDLNSLTT